MILAMNDTSPPRQQTSYCWPSKFFFCDCCLLSMLSKKGGLQMSRSYLVWVHSILPLCCRDYALDVLFFGVVYDIGFQVVNPKERVSNVATIFVAFRATCFPAEKGRYEQLVNTVGSHSSDQTGGYISKQLAGWVPTNRACKSRAANKKFILEGSLGIKYPRGRSQVTPK